MIILPNMYANINIRLVISIMNINISYQQNLLSMHQLLGVLTICVLSFLLYFFQFFKFIVELVTAVVAVVLGYVFSLT